MIDRETPSSEFASIPEVGGEANGTIEPQNFQKSQVTSTPSTESEHNLPDHGQFPANNTKRDSNTLQDIPPKAPCGSDKLGESAHKKGEPKAASNQSKPIDSNSSYLDMKGVGWTKDLSSGGQWLMRELLIGAEDISLLRQYARDDGIDLDAAVKELDRHELIDRNEPGILHLPWKKLPPQGS